MSIELRVVAASYEVALLPPIHRVPGLFPGFISYPHLVLMYLCFCSGPLWSVSSVNFTSYHLYYVLTSFLKCTFDIVDMTTMRNQFTFAMAMSVVIRS